LSLYKHSTKVDIL